MKEYAAEANMQILRRQPGMVINEDPAPAQTAKYTRLWDKYDIYIYICPNSDGARVLLLVMYPKSVLAKHPTARIRGQAPTPTMQRRSIGTKDVDSAAAPWKLCRWAVGLGGKWNNRYSWSNS